MNIFVARQPIFNNKNKVMAYELLYRDSMVNQYDGHLSDNVSKMIKNALLNIEDKFTDVYNMYLSYEKCECILAEASSKKLDII